MKLFFFVIKRAKVYRVVALISALSLGADYHGVCQTASDPFDDAEVTWHMKNPLATEIYPIELAANGRAKFGEELSSDEYQESLKRGGDGFVAELQGGWFSLDRFRAKRYRPGNDAITLYVRAKVEPDGEGSLFFSDFISLTIHRSGLAILLLGSRTSTGKTFREIPLGFIKRGQWLDLIVRIGGARLDFYCNGILVSAVPIKQKLDSPFDDELLIGAFKSNKPDLYGTSIPTGFPNCKIDAVAIWKYPLSDNKIAFLSGVNELSKLEESEMKKALLNYNAIFDASVDKDVKACDTIWKALQVLAKKDPLRPTYHLTQPLGHIFDPAGAYFYGGKYHVFSYRNIFSLLNYSSLDHYVSNDLVNWTAWPIGPLADNNADVFGIYLMNHFIDDDGKPRILYTGQGTDGKFGVLARSDDSLISYTDKKPVLTNYHHDGHVWKEGSTWFTITSRMFKNTRRYNLGDAVMLWSSTDLENWKERSEIFTQKKDTLSKNHGDRAGFMEFPYLLNFGKKDVMILGGHPVRYWVGRYNRESLKFESDQPDGKLLDYSNPFHCYNPLAVDSNGPGRSPRRLVMALYAGIGGGSNGLLPWSAVHAMPRALSLDGDHLRQDPLPEFQALRADHYLKRNIKVIPGKTGYISKRGDCMEIVVEFDPGDSKMFGIKVRLSDDRKSFVRVFYDSATGEYGVDGKAASGKGPSYIEKGQKVKMHVFIDKLLVEAFVNGLTCTTSAQDKDLHFNGCDLFSEGGTAKCTRLDIWDIKGK